MNLDGTRRVMETTNAETANHYLRFGWVLLNQYLTEATEETPAKMTFVLASVRRLEDTREVLRIHDEQDLNKHLQLGWRLIDKFVTTSLEANGRQEQIHYLVAWQSDDAPLRPEAVPEFRRVVSSDIPSDEQLY